MPSIQQYSLLVRWCGRTFLFSREQHLFVNVVSRRGQDWLLVVVRAHVRRLGDVGWINWVDPFVEARLLSWPPVLLGDTFVLVALKFCFFGSSSL